MARAMFSRVVIALLCIFSCRDSPAVVPGLVLTRIVGGLDRPVAITTAPGAPGRLFVTEQGGRVRIVEHGTLFPTPFLDISRRISCCGERGLLSIAFHPGFQANGYVFADYTDVTGDTVVARFRTEASNPDRIDPSSEHILLHIAQPFANHNGGQLQFGPDGFLYVGTGDGGSAGDPGNRAQNPDVLLGKILRLDVSGDGGYSIPPSNPLIAGKRSELWARGLRNPWRFSFDSTTGDLYIADVGQNLWEEIDVQPASSPGGENYGWNLMEASHCYKPTTLCDNGTLVKPILEYSHNEGCSVTGGFVYRGKSGRLYGSYLFGDYCTGFIRAATRSDAGWTSTTLLNTGFRITCFGQDGFGEVYVVDYGGTIYRIDDTRVRRRPARPNR